MQHRIGMHILYLYGLGRIGELQPGGFLYHLGDALGSVRQLVDTSGEVKLARSYEPYGGVLSSSGNAASAYAFTGESYDLYTELIMLRARWLSPKAGRFLTKDLWPPDYNRPSSLNSWLYAYSDPINLTDPSGHVPCAQLADDDREQCLNSPPRIKGYSERTAPRNVTWFPGDFSPVATIIDAAGKVVPPGTHASQYLIQAGWNGLCGEITLASLLMSAQTGISANEVVAAYVALNSGADPNYTGASEIAWLANQKYGSYFYANEEFAKGEYWETFFARHWLQNPDRDLAPQLRYWLAMSQYVIAGVPIMSAGSLITDYTAGRVGRTTGSANDRCKSIDNPTGLICHWVAITGVSNEWNYGFELSPWNWLRIYNPFDNQTEFYWWPDFKGAWSIHDFGMILLNRKQSSPPPSRPGQAQ